MDQRKLTAITLLDLSRAFDSISHRILLTKLQEVGASHSSIQWVRSYLAKGTKQSGLIQPSQNLSTLYSQRSPSRQYSCSASFQHYFNYFPSAARKCSSQCYVDDTKLLVFFQIQDKQSAISYMNEDLFNVRNWCSETICS